MLIFTAMKTRNFLFVVCALSAQTVFSQKADDKEVGNFEKKVEYNTLGGDNMYNVRSKSTFD